MQESNKSKKTLQCGIAAALVVLGASAIAPEITPEPHSQNKNIIVQPVTHEDFAISQDNAKIHFIDTGNSDAILLQVGEEFALIDGGENDDEELIVEYLQSVGVTKLKYLFATHMHADHIGGLDAVVDHFEIEHVFVGNGTSSSQTYKDFIMALSMKQAYPSVPLKDSVFYLGNSTIKVLSAANTDDANNNSLVLLFQNGNDKVLLMGDAEKEIENVIDVPDVDLIKIGHHGSKSSSGKSFIKRANPEYAVITVGAENKYGHPHKETLETLENENITTYRTDQDGTIVFTSTSNGLIVEDHSKSIIK